MMLHCRFGNSYAKMLKSNCQFMLGVFLSDLLLIALFVIAIRSNYEMANCKEHGIRYEHSDYR